MDLCKIDDHYVLTADLPGVDPGSVDVDVDNGILTVSAQRTAASSDAVQWLTNERFFASYRRQLSLGDGVDTARVSATYENGVLTVTVPLAERAKPRKIDVARGETHKEDHADDGRRRLTVQRPVAPTEFGATRFAVACRQDFTVMAAHRISVDCSATRLAPSGLAGSGTEARTGETLAPSVGRPTHPPVQTVALFRHR